MKELSSHPRSRLITLPQHDDPLGRFSDDEDTGPIDLPAPAEVRPGPGYATRPHEISGYISASGRRAPEPDDTVHDWSMGHAATWEDVDDGRIYLAHRYEPKPPRTVQMVATAAVCGLLGYSLYLDRPDFSAIKSWLTRSDVIELPAISPPPLPSRLADEPGRVATLSSPTVPERGAAPETPDAPDAPAAASARQDAGTTATRRLDLMVDDAGVSIVSGRATAKDAPRDEKVKPRETGRTAASSPATLTQALNAASLSPGATRRAGSETAAPRAVNSNGDAAQVRGVLTNFQVAYNSLDVDGTRKLWPGVDAAALARVFQSLQSQHLELSGCQVAVAGDQAKAMCGGQARMVPKDKSKAPRVESRQWTFDLHRSVDRWDVVALNLK